MRRPGMYDGESFLLQHLGELAFIDQAEQVFESERKDLEKRGAYTATGIGGAFGLITGVCNGYSDEVASVIAEIAYRMGYLKLEGALSQAEYIELRNGLRQRCRQSDWTLTEIQSEYGEASWGAKRSNLLYPCSLAYGSVERRDRWVFFDFWNEIVFTEDRHPIGKYGDVPMLRNVRVPAATFKREFTFTPFGRRLLKEHAK